MRLRLDATEYGPQNRDKILKAIADSENISPALLKAMTPTGTKEEDIQAAIMRELKSKGYTCLQTTVRVKLQKCPECGGVIRPLGNTGASKGVPDLLVRADNWPMAAWIGMEVKGLKTQLSAEQKALYAQGAIVVVRSVEMALTEIAKFEETLKEKE